MSLQVLPSSQNDYLNQRIKSLDLSKKEARKYGILSDDNDNIVLLSRLLNGEFAQKTINQKFIDKRNKGKSGAIEQNEFIKAIRFNPSYLKANPTYYSKKEKNFKETPKYLFERGYNLLNYMPLVCEAYNASKKIDILTFQEGTFKAVAHDKNGLFAINGNGILNYKLTNDLKELILKTGLENFVIFHDGDFNQISTKGEILSDKRVNDFKTSALNLANQLYNFQKEHDLKFNIYYAAVNPKQAAKGFDDLLEQERKTGNESAVIEAYKNKVDNKYFIFRKLFKSSARKQIEKYLNIDSLERFYDANKDVLSKIFVFNGVKYQQHKNGSLVVIKNNYLKVDTTNLKVKKYLGEQEDEIYKLIQKYKRIAIDAPTGAGKTTLLLNIIELLKLTGRKAVFVAPTQILTKAIFEDAKNKYINTSILCGGVPTDLNYLDSSLIISTYDKLTHVTDIENRVLIVDESHNLVSAYSYRNEAIKYFQIAIHNAQKTVLLSGTHNDLMLNVFDFHKVKIQVEQQQIVNVLNYVCKSEKDRLTQLLTLLDYNTSQFNDNIDIVLFNSEKQLQIIKETVIKNYDLEESQVCIITSNEKDGAVYQSIINDKIIPKGIKLVLTTCILAEGISINNTNISSLIAVSTHQQKLSTELLKQFSARLRNLKEVDLHLILQSEKILNSSYLDNKLSIFESDVLSAKAQIIKAKSIVKNRSEYLNNAYDYDSTFINHTDKTIFHNHIFETSFNSFHVNKLSILSDIEERQNIDRNNLVLLSELSEYDNVKIVSENELNTGDDLVCEIEVKQMQTSLKEAKKAIKEQKESAILTASQLLQDEEKAAVFVESVYFEKKQNRQLKSYLEKLHFKSKPSFQSAESLEFSEKHNDLINTNFCNEIVKAYVFLKAANAPLSVFKTFIDNWNIKEFKRFKKRFKFFVKLEQSKSAKHKISNLELLDLNSKYEFYKIAVEKINDKTILTSKNINYIITNCKCYKKCKCKAKKYSIREAKQALELFYDFDIKRNSKKEYIYCNFKNIQSEFYEYLSKNVDFKEIDKNILTV
jgi:hypothetical protein